MEKTIGEMTVSEFVSDVERIIKSNGNKPKKGENVHYEPETAFRQWPLYPIPNNAISLKEIAIACNVGIETVRQWKKGFLSPAILEQGRPGRSCLFNRKTAISLIKVHRGYSI